MMGGTFIINATIIIGNFKEISVLMCSRLWKINLNNFLLEISLAVLLLQASFVASSFDSLFGIHDHPSFVTQSNNLKTLTIASRVLNDESTFPSSQSSCASFGVPILVDC